MGLRRQSLSEYVGLLDRRVNPHHHDPLVFTHMLSEVVVLDGDVLRSR